MESGISFWQKLPWGKIGVGAFLVAAIVVAVIIWQPSGAELKDILPHRGTPPWLFIVLMVVIPLVGGPVSVFFVLSGVIFGTVEALAVCAGSISIHLLAAYGIAHGVGRRLLLAVFHRFNYDPPSIPDHHKLKVTLAFFAIPGLPYAAKAYLFAMTDVPFLLYFITALVVNMGYAALLVVLGGAATEVHWLVLGIIVVALLVVYSGIKFLKAGTST